MTPAITPLINTNPQKNPLQDPNSGVPAFARNSVDFSKVQEQPAFPQIVGNGQVVSDVMAQNPNTIQVRQPSMYDAGARAHEATHVSQYLRQDGVQPGLTAPGNQQNLVNTSSYDYGGPEGLIKAQQQHKTMNNYTQEQQAKMVEDDTRQSKAIEAKAAAGFATPADLQRYDLLRQAYHPFLKQLAPQPVGNAINTHPEPPGLPPASTPGMMILSPDPLLGGNNTLIRKR